MNKQLTDAAQSLGGVLHQSAMIDMLLEYKAKGLNPCDDIPAFDEFVTEKLKSK